MHRLRAFLDPAGHAHGVREGFALVRRHARLIVEMARRDLTQRYAGQFIGSVWIVAHPLLLTLLYIFLFATVFKMKMGGSRELPLDYTTYLLAGLIPWLTFQTAMSASCSAVLASAGLVKQFVFPLEILPVKEVATATVIWIVGMSTVAVYVSLTHGSLPITYVLVPILLILQLLAMVGVAFLVAAITVFFRDLKDLVQVLSMVGIFLMPVVYVPDMVPAVFRPLLYLNPFSYMTWAYQDALYFGRIEHPWAWLVFGVGSVFTFGLGYRVFVKLKPHFSNAL